MYIIKNALISIWRNKGRNILIGIIIMIISAACAVTLAIRSSADKIVKSYENKYPIEATIGMDRKNLTESLKGESSREEMIEAFNKIKSITQEEIDKYGDSEYVDKYYYTYSISLNGKDLDEATDSLVKETTTTKTETTTRTETTKRPNNIPSGRPDFPNRDQGSTTEKKTTTNKKTTTSVVENIRNEKANKGTFNLIGYNSYDAMTDFINGNYKIKSGNVDSDFTSDSCVISEELATLNDIKVDDEITLVSPYDTKITYKLKVTGIYESNTDDSSDMSSMYSNSANTIITNVTVVENIVNKDEDIQTTITPTFILKSSDVVNKFGEEVKEKGLSEYYTVTNNLDVVNNATKSIVSVKKFATTFLLITLIIGAVVLFVINMINIRERKYEIGVLRTIGMKKVLVCMQFMIELLLVCIVTLLIGAGIGSLTSVKVSNELLSSEIENAESDYEEINNNFGGGMRDKNFKDQNFGIVNIEKVDKMDAIVDFKVLLQLLGIGVILTIVSSISSMIAISRFSPLQILKERS